MLLKTYRKQYKIFLVVFSNTVINPRTMVIHFSDTPEIKYKKKKLKCNSRIIKLTDKFCAFCILCKYFLIEFLFRW